MNSLITICIRHRFLVIFGVLLVGALGVRAARQIPVDAVPDVTNVQVQALTNAPSLGPLEVEQYITLPVENALSGIPGVERIRSLSQVGLSAVTVDFIEGTDLLVARQHVAQRLNEARQDIPQAYGSPEMGPLTSGLGEIYQFEVRSDRLCPQDAPEHADCHTLMELRSILDWSVALQLRTVPGVVEINAFGGELKTYEVQVDPVRLGAYGLSLGDIFDALKANNANAGGGYIQGHGEQRVIRGEALIESLDELRHVRVATREHGTPIFIKDVAEVAFAPMLRQGAVTRDGRGEAVTAIVTMLVDANAAEVAHAVDKRLEEIARGLPEGVSIDTFYDRAELVDRTVRTVATNLIEGATLVIVVLLLMLGNLRGGLLIASIIPLALLITFIVMRALGVSANLMSLGALDFGLIIDGGIVVIEHIVRRLSQTAATNAQRSAQNVAQIVRDATIQVMRPVLFGTAIIMIVYIPILSLEGISAKMFRPMAIAVLAALGGALLLAITLVPAAASWLFKNGVKAREPRLARLAQRIYDPLLHRALKHRALVITAAIILLLAGGWLATTMGAEFLPRLDEGAIAMQAIRPPSVSLEASIEATTRIEQTLLEKFPDEVKTVVSRTGRAEIATDPMGVDLSDIFVMLHPKEAWRFADMETLVDAIEEVLEDEVPGQNYAFSQPIELRTNELISGVSSDVAVIIYGPQLEELNRAGDRIMQILASIDGAADLSADSLAGLPTLRVVIDRAAAARQGIDASDILDAVAAMGGQPVGTIFEGQERYTLQVRLVESARNSPQAIESLLLTTPDGRRVQLGQVARVFDDEGPAVINRQDAQRRRVIEVNVRGRDLGSFVREAQARVAAEADLAPGYFVAWGGQFENLQAAASRLIIAVPAALLLIFLLLYTMFGAARPALIIYLNIPIATVGGIVALWLRQMPFSISAAVGFIALSGIAVLNGLVMISYVRDLQREGLSLMDATEKGARLRLRAILMTALTDGLGFLPMTISTGAGAEVQQPLATVVVGGLVTSTFLTLFVLPAIYSLLGDSLPPPPTHTPKKATI